MPFLDCNGLDIYYHAPRGLPENDADVVVLLIHGAGGSSRHWHPLLTTWLDMLPTATHIYPIAIDLPGHGHSSGRVLTSVGAIADFFNVCLDSFGISQPVCYVGHSAGGLLGIQFALSYRQRIDRLMLISTAASIQLHPDFLQQALTGDWDYAMLQNSFSPAIPDHLKQLVLNEFQYLRLAAGSTDFMDLNQVNLHAELSRLHLPVFVVTGDDDVIISPRKSKLLQKELPEADLLVIKGGGHYVQVEQAPVVSTALTQLLQMPQVATCRI
jgi:pimeloyl-ACP methyl ester carboxylesterase